MTEQLTRTEKIKMGSWYLPEDLSQFTTTEKNKYPNHPLEQYEQLLADLIIKGIVPYNYSDKYADRHIMKRLKSLSNYGRQSIEICRKCTQFQSANCNERKYHPTPLHSKCGVCRVLRFQDTCEKLYNKMMAPTIVIEEGNIYLDQNGQRTKQQSIVVKRSRWRSIWNNRWNWKKKCLASESIEGCR